MSMPIPAGRNHSISTEQSGGRTKNVFFGIRDRDRTEAATIFSGKCKCAICLESFITIENGYWLAFWGKLMQNIPCIIYFFIVEIIIILLMHCILHMHTHTHKHSFISGQKICNPHLFIYSLSSWASQNCAMQDKITACWRAGRGADTEVVRSHYTYVLTLHTVIQAQ